MNDLSLFNSNQKATSKEVVTTKQLAENNRQVNIASTEFVTVKELANILHVSDQTVRNIVKELFDPSKLLWRVVNGGNTLYLTTEQATAVKLKLRDRNNLKDNSIVSQIGNDLEFFALLKKREEEQKILDAYRDRRIAELQAENERQKQQLTEQAPKVATYNRIANATGLKSMQEVAKILHIGSKMLFATLRDKKIFYREKSNGVNIPVEKYIKQGLFEVKEEPYRKDGKDCVYTRIFATAKGLLWLEKIIQDLEVSND